MNTLFSFFKLPLELRLAVYEELFPAPTEDEQAKTIRIDSKKGRPPGLLRTCRAIREECAPIYLKHKKFKVTVTSFDTNPCDTWFSFFKAFDTSKVYLQIEWKQCLESRDYSRSLMSLLVASYKGESHVFPESPLRQWTVAPAMTRHRVTHEGTYSVTMDYNVEAVRDGEAVDKLRHIAVRMADWQSRGMPWQKAAKNMARLVEGLKPSRDYTFSFNF